MASRKYGTLYVGVTSNLQKRIWEHREGEVDSFPGRYEAHNLVYYEVYDDITDAIAREKQLKRWHREWKCNLVDKANPDWHDLYPTLT